LISFRHAASGRFQIHNQFKLTYISS
jgi:hypothetical protein